MLKEKNIILYKREKEQLEGLILMDNALIFTYPTMILETHLDLFGHVNNASYLEILEEARWDLITKRGFGLKHIQETGIGPVILEIRIKFIKELVARDSIIIETKTKSYERKIGVLTQNIMRAGQCCCTADFTFGLFDLKARKLIEPTPEWKAAIGI